MKKTNNNNLNMNDLGKHDRIKFWHAQRFEDMECLSATFVEHRYPTHFHDTYSIGIMVRGAEKFRYNGTTYIAPQGSIAALSPQMTHDGEPVGQGFVYRMFYPSIELMTDIQQDLSGKTDLPHFKTPVHHDDMLARQILAMHTVLEKSGDTLEQDSAFALVLSSLITRHAEDQTVIKPVGREHGPLAKVRTYLDDLYDQDVGLNDLAQLANLNRHYMIRAFRKETGMTPHAYQTMRRVQAAKKRLEAGDPASDVALACGFCDQSHLNRHFKRHFGLTPGQYRKQFEH